MMEKDCSLSMMIKVVKFQENLFLQLKKVLQAAMKNGPLGWF